MTGPGTQEQVRLDSRLLMCKGPGPERLDKFGTLIMSSGPRVELGQTGDGEKVALRMSLVLGYDPMKEYLVYPK